MTCSVLVYSADPVRGKILQRACTIGGFPACHCASIPQFVGALNATVPDVVIVDAAGSDFAEMRRLAAVCRILKKSFTIILSGTLPRATVQSVGLQGAAVLPDPLDPDQALALIRQVADNKKKTACAASANVSPPMAVRSGSAYAAASCCCASS